jgi:hypothetical protein
MRLLPLRNARATNARGAILLPIVLCLVTHALALALGAWGGASLAGQRAAALQLEQAQAQHALLRAALEREQAARQRGDAAAAQLAQRTQAIANLLPEKTHALQRAATGRTCFAGSMLSVLNGATGLRVAGLPPNAGTPRQPFGEDATAAAHTGAATPQSPGADAPAGQISTDADVAQWALSAGSLYETCRERLHSLIDYVQPPATPVP